MLTRLLAVLLMATALFIWGCPKDEDDPPPPPVSDNASGTASSSDTTVTTIQTPAGAKLTVPPGAVPTFSDGTPATQTFSIERTNSSPVNVPAGETLVSDIYRFGPEGFTFAAPVMVTLPVLNAHDSSDVFLYRTNQATGEAEQMPAVYDPVAKTITAPTYDFCCWFTSERPRRNTASGCIDVNNLSNHWVRVCVDTYDLTFPEQAVNMASYGEGGLWAPSGTIGWANRGNFYIPQGTYRLCIQYGIQEFQGGPIRYVHRYEDNVTVNAPWNYWTHPNCSANLTFSNPVSPDTGRCNCVPQPSTPAHTGEVQVTLTWYVNDAEGLDLDLHVIEPSGEEIYYGHRTSATGGQLDIDNICGDFRNGISENIFWTTNPPSGQYIVKVDYFGDCNSDNNVQWFTIRTVVRGNTRTFQNSVGPGEEKEITRFNVSGGSVNYLPPSPEIIVKNYPPKN